MADLSASVSTIETRDDAGDGPESVVGFWLQQLELAEKEDRDYVRRGRKIVQRYRDHRPQNHNKNARFNILWANVEVLRPILYGRAPKPDVERRHKTSDPIARLGAEILERALAYEDDMDEFDAVMKRVVEDRLLPGRGVARVLYEATFGEEEEDPSGEVDEETEEPKTFRPVENEKAPVEYVYWEDYRQSPSRIDKDVWWRAYRSYLTRDELVKRFGRKVGKAVTLDYAPKGLESDSDGPKADAFKKAQVWEIWDKTKQQVVWIAPSYNKEPLDTKGDPLDLPGFFPSPRPLSATMTNDTTLPVPDYQEYQDQAIELDVLTARIDKLTAALQVKGLYAGGGKAEIQQLLDPDSENTLIPVEDWAAFMDKGGLSGMIVWLPIEQIAKVLIQLYDARDRVQRTLYQVTGMADILRGETNPTETLGAQQLKSQFATRRISESQKEVARFARDLMRLRGFVMARHFSPETLMEMTGLPEALPDLPPMPPMMVPAPPQQPQQMGGNVVPMRPGMGAAA